MSQKPGLPQEEAPKTEQVNVRMTLPDKSDVRLVAAFDQTTESETVWTYSAAQIRERAAAIRAGEAPARERVA